MRTLLLSLSLTLLTAAAAAEEGVALTVYNDNLALVRDVRIMDFGKGAGEMKFRDVAAQIDATSVHFSAAGVDLLEQNFDYDLVSPEKLLEKYIDQTIEVVGETGDIARGILLTSGGGQLTLQQADGSLRSMLLESATEIRYPNLPEGLITRPTLRWLVHAKNGGKQEAEVSYLTGGLSWRADYVLVVADKSAQADLGAWVTINNTSGAGYKNAKLKLIAGEVHRAQPQRSPYVDMEKSTALHVRGGRGFEVQAFFEYHLYTLQRPATVQNNQTKQISLFPNTTVESRRIYEFDWRRKQDRVGVSIEFDNTQKNNLGIPLPAGRVRVYQKGPDGAQEFIGEDNLEHTPKDEKVRVLVGEAFDIAVERVQKDYRRISDRVSETDWEVKLRNHKDEAVTIVVTEHFWGDWEIMRSSLPSKKISAVKVEFSVPVERDKETVLTYTVRNR